MNSAFKALGTIAAHVGTRFFVISDYAAEHAEKTDNGGVVEKNYRIAALEAHGKRARIIPVDYKPVGSERFTKQSFKVVFCPCLPVAVPVEAVKMHHGMQRFAEPERKSRLAAAASHTSILS